MRTLAIITLLLLPPLVLITNARTMSLQPLRIGIGRYSVGLNYWTLKTTATMALLGAGFLYLETLGVFVVLGEVGRALWSWCCGNGWAFGRGWGTAPAGQAARTHTGTAGTASVEALQEQEESAWKAWKAAFKQTREAETTAWR